jgi:hypothetical protein
MVQQVLSTLDFVNNTRIINLPAGVADGDAVNMAQMKAQVEGLGWKDNARVASVANVTIATPGASINGVSMTANDRVLLKDQTAQPENGLYIWNGAAVPMTRALDASTFDELESAVITIDEGTSAGATFRQTQVNGVIGTNNVIWASFGTSSPAASETTSGIAELATQAETDAGTDDLRIVTPLKLKNSIHAAKKFEGTIGDGSATSYVVTHNLNSKAVAVSVYRNSGNFDEVLVEVQKTSLNTVTVVFLAAPSLNQYAVAVTL